MKNETAYNGMGPRLVGDPRVTQLYLQKDAEDPDTQHYSLGLGGMSLGFRLQVPEHAVTEEFIQALRPVGVWNFALENISERRLCFVWLFDEPVFFNSQIWREAEAILAMFGDLGGLDWCCIPLPSPGAWQFCGHGRVLQYATESRRYGGIVTGHEEKTVH